MPGRARPASLRRRPDLGRSLGEDHGRALGGDGLLGNPLVAVQPLLELLDDPGLRGADAGRGAGGEALAALAGVVVLEALVADLPPDAAGARADDGGRDQAGR